MIAGIGRNLELGKDNDLLWHIPEDLAHFKQITNGAPVLMGRATYLSLPEAFRPLPHRDNIVLMRETEDLPGGDEKRVVIVHDVPSAFSQAMAIAKQRDKKELFVIGGASLYAQTIELVDRLYLTEVDETFADADVFFPPYKHLFTREVSRQHHDNGRYAFDFVILEK